ncbi:hypothetical protein NBO_27g0022 [Nosema bombycis CQ1]|uniref:Uncharacterized protein n=1 Tax=Nosema bombycis (strain CQ1 / CVCC 102059) TaxID=578461 RepID=R0MJS2_NOSB1|nr:hypothetical protein NBO_27g0022 [Nosema bombycis CQ1]|eukprot:EOB14465.1 hypothetical protein NBO_27g0022 [Nosema bombycis CQ1]
MFNAYRIMPKIVYYKDTNIDRRESIGRKGVRYWIVLLLRIFFFSLIVVISYTVGLVVSIIVYIFLFIYRILMILMLR